MSHFYPEIEAVAIARHIVGQHTKSVLKCAELNGTSAPLDAALVGCEVALMADIVNALTGKQVTISQRDLIDLAGGPERCSVPGCAFERGKAFAGRYPCQTPWAGDPSARQDYMRGCSLRR